MWWSRGQRWIIIEIIYIRVSILCDRPLHARGLLIDGQASLSATEENRRVDTYLTMNSDREAMGAR